MIVAVSPNNVTNQGAADTNDCSEKKQNVDNNDCSSQAGEGDGVDTDQKPKTPNCTAQYSVDTGGNSCDANASSCPEQKPAVCNNNVTPCDGQAPGCPEQNPDSPSDDNNEYEQSIDYMARNFTQGAGVETRRKQKANTGDSNSPENEEEFRKKAEEEGWEVVEKKRQHATRQYFEAKTGGRYHHYLPT